jgi:hypothetical protein
MATQVDSLASTGDSVEEGADEVRVVGDEREDGAIVVGVRVDIEDVRACGERDAERRDRLGIPTLGEVRDRFERQLHARTLGT